jgi:hypothetical protein
MSNHLVKNTVSHGIGKEYASITALGLASGSYFLIMMRINLLFRYEKFMAIILIMWWKEKVRYE